MPLDDHLRRTLDSLSDRVREETERQLASLKAELGTTIEQERVAAAAQAAAEARKAAEQEAVAQLNAVVAATEARARETLRRASDTAREQGRELGHAQGIEQGTELGRREGLEQGKREGLELGRHEGLEQGKREGLELGRREGLEQGKREGLEQGKREGVDLGRREGLELGKREGHEQGRKEGHEQGRKEGYEQGRKEGHEQGRKLGNELGRKEGHEEGRQAGWKAGLLEGKQQGRAEGLDQGRTEGREQGRQAGKAEGLEEGRAAGREEGFEDGRENGLTEGRRQGHEEGFAEGREEGFTAGRKEGVAEGRKEGIAEGRRAGFADGHEEGWRAGKVEGREEARAESQSESVAARAAALDEQRTAELAANERLIDAVRAIDKARSLTEVLDALVSSAGREAKRVAVLIVRSGQLRGWRFIGFGAKLDEQHDAQISSRDAGAIAEAARTGQAVSADSGGAASAPAFAELPPGRELVAVPVQMSGQVVAVLYADQGASHDPQNLAWPMTLEVMARHAARCLESITAFRAAQVLTERPEVPTATDPQTSYSEPAGASAEQSEAARRYARLLVSEIKLYHESAVIAGRRDRDLATRLGGEIARARVLYEQRVPRETRLDADYFHEELVKTLADGDRTLLEMKSSEG